MLNPIIIRAILSGKHPTEIWFSFEPELHRSYTGVIEDLYRLLSIKKTKGLIKIKYQDNENDWIDVSSQEEWDLALTFPSGGQSLYPSLGVQNDGLQVNPGTLVLMVSIQPISAEEKQKLKEQAREQKHQERILQKQAKQLDKIARIENKLKRKEAKKKLFDGVTAKQEIVTQPLVQQEVSPSQHGSFVMTIAQPSAPVFEETGEHLLRKKEKHERKFMEKELRKQEKEKRREEKLENKQQMKEENEVIAQDDIALYDAKTQEFSHRLPPNIRYIFVDANNMLYLTYALRTLVIFKKDKISAEKLLIYIARLFKGHMEVMLNHHVDLFHIVFDSTSNMSVMDNGTFVVSSSQDEGFSIADDMLVDIANKHSIAGSMDNCLFVTSDRGLRKRLKSMKAKCVGSGQWLKYCYHQLCSDTCSVDMNEWMMQLLMEA